MAASLHNALHLPERNAGQANAMDRISRNIARYAQTQAMGATPVVAETPMASGDSAPTFAAAANSTVPSAEAADSRAETTA